MSNMGNYLNESSLNMSYDEIKKRAEAGRVSVKQELWASGVVCHSCEKQIAVEDSHVVTSLMGTYSFCSKCYSKRKAEMEGVQTPGTVEPLIEPLYAGRSGAVCSKVRERFDLICPTGLRRLAMRYALGAERYGDDNWCKAGDDPAFQRQRLNHLIKHVTRYLQHGGTCDDDDLAAIAWNAFALMHYEEGCKCHETRKAGEEKPDR